MLNEDSRLILTPAVWNTIKSVQKKGNKIIWTPDETTWGSVERWEFPKEVGRKMLEDCDGITLWKMRALLEAGIPPAPLLFTICRTEEGEHHAVLCVTTDRGDFVLDNRFDAPEGYGTLKKKGYKFLFRSKIGGRLTDAWDRIAQ